MTGNPPSVTHDFADDDPAPAHVVTAIAFTSANQSATATRTVTVNNVAPTVTVANLGATVNKAATFTLGSFTDPGYTVAANGTAETFTGTINWGDNTAVDPVTLAVTPGSAVVLTSGTVAKAHTYTKAGTFTAKLTINDDNTGATSKPFTVTVAGASSVPVVTAAAFTPPVNEGSAVTFSGTFTDADAGTASIYGARVNWGDGSADTIVTLSAGANSTTFNVSAPHTYADNRAINYTATLTVTDPTNNTASKTATATVANVAPTVTSTAAAQFIGVNVPLTVQAAAFKDPGFSYTPAGTVETFNTTTIAWGDTKTDIVSPTVVQGSVGTFTTGTVTGTHTYTAAGTKTVTVTVKDDDTGTATTTFQVTVGGSAPVLGTPAAMTKSENVAVPFSMTFTDADAEPAAGIKAVITWGDGSGTTTVTPTLSGSTYTVASSHIYADNKTGNYPVSVTVTDKYGYAVTKTATATVTNTAPTATAGAAQTTKFGQPLTFPLLTFTDPGFTHAPAGTAETFSVTVDWNDATAKQTFTPDVVQGSAGVNTTGKLTGTLTFATTKLAPYQVSMTVTDDDTGTSNTVIVPVTVTGGEIQVYDTFTVVTIDLSTFDTNASYRNELGFYLTATDGSVPDPNWPADATKRVLPGGVGAVGPAPTNKPAVGYAEAAVVSPSRQVAFARNTTLGRKFQVALDPNTRIAFYGVQDATTDFWLANNRPNVVSGTNVFFSIRAANPDFDNQAGFTTQKAEHFRVTDLADGKGSLRYSFEDLDSAGDHDFNDLEFTLRSETNNQTKAVKFFVGDSAVDRTYTYNAQATNVGSTALAPANTDVSGTASNPDGSRVWNIDRAGKAVYVYNADGTAAGTWTPAPKAGAPAFVSLTDVGTDGTDLWLVDAGNGTAGTRRLLLYRSAAGRTGGANVPADAEFSLDATNTAASGLAVGHYSTTQTRVWVTNAGAAANTNQVFVYDFDPIGNAGAGKMVTAGNWQLDVGNTDPGDIANDPTLVSPSSDLWVLDRSDRQIYHYPTSKAWVNNTGTTKGYHESPLVYGLLGPTLPEGIADPPPTVTVTVNAPLVPEGTLSSGNVVLVTGTVTSSDKLPTAVTVNGTGVSVLDAGGQYFAPITLKAGPNPVNVTAASADGTASQTVSTTVLGRTPDPKEGIDFGGLADVTSALAPEYGRTSFHMGTNVLYAELAARHVGSDVVRTPLLVAVHHVTQAGVRVVGTDGRTPSDAAVPRADYYDYTERVTGGSLSGTQVSGTGTVGFSDPDRVRFGHTVSFLGAVNRPPRFITPPVVEITVPSGGIIQTFSPLVTTIPVVIGGSPGKYFYPARAADPDRNEALTFRVVRGPVGLVIVDETTGVVTWDNPTIDDVGVHDVVLEVADKFGRTARQAYKLRVRTGVPNGPRYFVTDPVVTAESGVQYQYPSRAMDPDSDPITYSLTQAPAVPTGLSSDKYRMTINSTTGAITWLPPTQYAGQTVQVTVKATDDHGNVAYQPYPITVSQVAGNHPPVIISKAPLNIEVGGGVTKAPPTADVIFVVDESGSMQGAQQWLTLMVPQLESGLVAGGLTNNRYGLVGFGAADPFPRQVMVGPDDADHGFFGSPAEIVTAVSTLVVSGGTEDGYAGINFAIDRYPVRPGAAVNIVLVTDENRDRIATDFRGPQDPTPTSGYPEDGGTPEERAEDQAAILDELRRVNALLNVVVTAKFIHQDGSPSGIAALGVDHNSYAYVQAAGGTYIRPSPASGLVTEAFVSPSNTMIPDYVDPAFVTSGAAWDIAPVRDGQLTTDTVTALSKAFVAVKVDEILRQVGGYPYLYPAAAVDADNDPLTWSFVGGAQGAIIDPLTGVMKWNPPAAPVPADYTFTIQVADGRGGTDKQTFTVHVAAGTNDPPTIVAPNTLSTAELNRAFAVRIIGADADGEALTYGLLPTGTHPPLPVKLTIDPVSGWVTWTPDKTYTPTPLSFDVLVADPRGGTARKTYQLTVVDPSLVNHPPAFTRPFTVPAATEGQLWTFPVAATDIDGDLMTFDGPVRPAGMGFDATSRTFGWKPERGQAGTHKALARVRDSRGGYDLEWFTVTVQAAVSPPPPPPPSVNHPPRIDSSGSPLALQGEPYVYAVRAVDPDPNDILIYSLAPFGTNPFPTGMTIDTATGIVRWTPGVGTPGTFGVTIHVADRPGSDALWSEESYQIVVPTDYPPNHPPVFDPVSGGPAFVGQVYSISVTATDPDAGDTIAGYARDAGQVSFLRPDGSTVSLPDTALTINASSGLVTVTAQTEVGTVRGRVRATDSRGLASALWLSIPINAAVNYPPAIDSNPSPSGAPIVVDDGQVYAYDLVATDKESDPITYTAAVKAGGNVTQPGVTMDAQGRLRWNTTGRLGGPYTVTVTATDNMPGHTPPASQTYIVNVRTDITAPSVRLDAGPDPVAVNQTVAVAVTAADDRGVVGRTIEYQAPGSTGWQAVTLDAAGRGTVVPTATGTLTFRARAWDAALNYSPYVSLSVRVVPVPTTNDPPQAVLSGPYAGATAAVTVNGTASDLNNNLTGWVLELQADGAWREVSRGTAPVSAALLGTVNASALAEGSYALRLTATDPQYTVQAGATLLTARNVGWVRDPADTLPVVAALTGSVATTGQPGKIDVKGKAYDPDNKLKFWVLESAPAGTTTWTTLVAPQTTAVGSSAADGVLLSALDLSTWAVGNYDVRLTAYDGAGKAVATATLAVTAPGTGTVNPPVNAKPTVALIKPNTTIGAAASVAVTGTVIDPDTNAGTKLTSWTLAYAREGSANFTTIGTGTVAVPTEGALGTFPAATLADGPYTLKLTAVDAAGATAEATGGVFVGNGTGWVPTTPPPSVRPSVSLASPLDNQSVADRIPVTGTVTVPTGATLRGWRLELVAGERVIKLADGTAAVPSVQILGTLDPTVLPDGPAALRLTAYDPAGVAAQDMAGVQIASGRLKVGSLTLTTTDLTVPVNGIPVTINRVYDSANSGKQQEFGYGWRLELGGFKADVDRNTLDWFGGIRKDSIVSVKAPDGTTDLYKFAPDKSFTGEYYPRFVAITPTFRELVVESDILLSPDGGYSFVTLDGDLKYDLKYIQTFEVRLHDGSGLKYKVDAETGDTLAVDDRRGNRLRFTDTGIKAQRKDAYGSFVTLQRPDGGGGSKPVSVDFQYDNTRIVGVKDLRGNSVTYKYDAAGNLSTVTDRAGKLKATYGYDAKIPHFVTAVTDPFGTKALAATFDPTTQRLSELADVNGTKAQFAYIPAPTVGDAERLKQTLTRDDNDPLTPNPVAEVAFDTKGNVLRAVDPAGIQNRFEYDTYSRPTKLVQVVGAADTDPGRPVNDPDDRATKVLAFDTYNGQPTYTKTPFGGESYVAYDKATGLPTSMTDAAGNTTYAGYDKKGNLRSNRTPEGVEQSFSYDPLTSDVTSATRNGVTTSLAYDISGQVTTAKDDRGNVVEQGYDGNGNKVTDTRVWVNPTNATDVRRFVAETKYDADDRVSESYEDAPEGTPYANRVKSTTEYDNLGRAFRTTDGHGNVATTVFDARGLVVQETGEDGSLTRTAYDADGRVSWVTDPFRTGQATAAILGTHTIYDVAGRATKTERVSGLGITFATDANGTGTAAPPTAGSYTVTSSTDTAYQAADGLTLWSRDAAGVYTRPVYEVYGRQVSSRVTNAADTVTYQVSGTTHFDPSGQVDYVTDPTGQKSVTVYDRDGRVVEAVAADGSSVKTHYDAEGRKDFEIDAVGQRTDYGYTTEGWLATVLSPAVADPATVGKTVRPLTKYGYDKLGHRTTITDANGRVTTFTFDDRGRQTGRTLPAVGGVSASESTVYDAKWGVVDYTFDFAGTKVDTVYDWEAGSGLSTALSRVAKVTYTKAGSPDQTQLFTYDPFGRVATVTDTTVGQADRVTSNTYDADGRVLSVTSPEGVLEYQYDVVTGQQKLMRTRSATAQPVSLEVAYGYDPLGRLATVTEQVRGGVTLAATDKLTTAYGYDALGMVQTVTVTKNGSAVRTTTNTYDTKRHWLSGVTNAGAGGTGESTFTYTRRVDGHVTQLDESVRQPNGTFVGTTAKYEYDGLDRLTREVVLHGAAVESDTAYSLDRVGNRLGLTVRDGADAIVKQVASTFDERDQLQTEATTGAGAGTLAVGYDANGSLTTTTKDGLLQSTRVYDARGRLAELRDGVGATAATYRYTVDGLRAGQTEGGATTLHLVDGLSPSGFGQVVEERTAGGLVVAQYVYGLGLDPISMSRDLNGTPATLEPALYLADGNSGVRQVIDLAGVVLAAYRYDAFGAKVSDVQQAGGLVNPIGYRGERYDATLGNYNLRARHYDPRAGRFTSMDPEQGNYDDVLQSMRYGYAGHNPVMHSDPSGREFSVGGLSAGIGIGLGLGGINLGWKAYNGEATGDDFIGFGLAISDALGCKGVAAFRSMMGLPFGMVLGAAVGFYGGFLSGFADALADDPNVSYESLMSQAITEGIIGAIEGIMAFAYLGRAGACFTAGTPLLTAEGSKAIEQLKVGDLVLARDEFDPTGPVEPKLVEEVFVYESQVLYMTIGGQRIGTTSEHPFFVLGRGWVKASELRVGDELASHDGQNATLEAIEAGEWHMVYNIRVQDHHTYFVGRAEWGFSGLGAQRVRGLPLTEPKRCCGGIGGRRDLPVGAGRQAAMADLIGHDRQDIRYISTTESLSVVKTQGDPNNHITSSTLAVSYISKHDLQEGSGYKTFRSHMLRRMQIVEDQKHSLAVRFIPRFAMMKIVLYGAVVDV